MKLIINIPCLNEEETLPLVLDELPKSIEGISEIEVQIVDDGSNDRTAKIAHEYGCRVIRHKTNRGLGRAFQSGLEEALRNGADILVNTDADNQYPAQFIPALVQPILAGDADIVIGNRSPWNLEHFSRGKRNMQFIGNAIIKRLVGVNVPDVVSGFRAYSREAMLNMFVTTRFSYTLDTLVQASKKGFKIVSIPISTNLPTRESRLIKSNVQFIFSSAGNLLRVLFHYESLRTFSLIGLILFTPGFLAILRFIYYYLIGQGGGHVQSLIIGAMMVIIAGGMFSLGLFAELVAVNRAYLEKLLYMQRRSNYEKKK